VQALRMYVNAMRGVHELTVDEETRRRLFDIGEDDIIHGDKVEIDFSALSTDMLEYSVRTGSLVERKEDQELEKLTTMLQPIIQNLNGWSEENRMVIENEVILPVIMRMLELSDTDLASSLSSSIGMQIAKTMMSDLQAQVDGQQGRIDSLQGQMSAMQQALPPESQEQLAQDPMADVTGAPVPNVMEASPESAPVMPMRGGETSPSLPAPPDDMAEQPEDLYDDLLTL
jgi:hypothetical protein